MKVTEEEGTDKWNANHVRRLVVFTCNIAKMSILPGTLYKLNKISINIPMIFIENKKFLKFI